MTFTSDKKGALEILVRMSLKDKDYSLFRETFQLMNPKLTDEDFKPMFPEGWSNDNKWPDFDKETNAEFWVKWSKHQIAIDYELECSMGC